MSPRARGRGRCAVCDRVFTLTFKGTIPQHRGHTHEAAGACGGTNQPPKAGSETSR